MCHISPMQLAQVLHQIFSAFDTTVQALDLFKVDTVGDAFIVAAWLPNHDLTPTNGILYVYVCLQTLNPEQSQNAREPRLRCDGTRRHGRAQDFRVT
jgi:hypothetical protein